MANMWRFAGLGAVVVLAVVGGIATGQNAGPRNAAQDEARRDPANLAGERVRAQVTEHPLPENTGVLALQQSLVKLRTRGESDDDCGASG